ncbi:MAG: CCA tRNA nucleotidyltransferase [Clostridia bacterium]
MNILIPKNVEFLLERLQTNGHSAYIVGGCLRDLLLKKTPKDWDICTSAKPLETQEIFKEHKLVLSGLKHGTVAVILEHEVYEITTFRIDGEYENSRRPKDVSFTSDIKEDLARRDFSINAMAYNKNESLIDCFEGEKDLTNKLINCVGVPEKRFSEDALRILRALRFASVYSFDIESETQKQIKLLKNTLKNISKERINTEFSKLLLGENATVILRNYAEVFEVFLPEIDFLNEKAISFLEKSSDNLSQKLAILFCYAGKKIEIDTENILKNLKYDNKTVSETSFLSKNFTTKIGKTKPEIKRFLRDFGIKKTRSLFEFKLLENENIYLVLLEEIIKNNECFCIKDLRITGKDLINLGYKSGENIGEKLNFLLDMVIEEKLENNKEKLINFLLN